MAFDLFIEVFRCGKNGAEINGDFSRSAAGDDTVFLQGAKKKFLHGKRHLFSSLNQKRAMIGLGEQPTFQYSFSRCIFIEKTGKL